MPFKVYRRLTPATQPFVTLPVTDAEAIALGQALVLSSGKLTKCGATAKPTHISEQAVVAGTGNTCVVHAVQPDIEYATNSQADVAATLIGAKVTLHTDGLSVTATTASGVATIVTTDTKKAVTVRFE